MQVAQGLLFLSMAVVFIALAVLVILQNSFLRLNSSIGIARDGLPPGKPAPSWQLPDLEGRLHLTPAGDHWQLLIFINQALAAFPDLVTGMHQLAATFQELEVLILSPESKQDCAHTVQQLGLQVPIVPIDAALSDRFRVRVMPFAFFLDPDGRVRWVGLVNTAAQLSLAWRMARAATAAVSLEGGGR
jgi:AhpC/TSA family